MTKDEIKKELEAKGIDFDPGATKADLLARLNEYSQPEAITFEVVKRLAEVGEVYKPGDKIQLTKKRADALGDLVKPASE